MFSMNELSKIAGININTLKYYLKINSDAYLDGLYPVNLRDMFEVRIKKSKKNKRGAYQKVFLRGDNPDIFIKELNRFLNFKQATKARRTVWNETAIECFDSGECNDKCTYYEICKRVGKQENQLYPMQNVVAEIIAEHGEPNEFDRSKIAHSIITQF